MAMTPEIGFFVLGIFGSLALVTFLFAMWTWIQE
jgi:hypothetical protein